MPNSADALKKLAFDLKQGLSNFVIVLASAIEEKANVVLLFDETIAAEKGLDAATLVKQKIAGLIKGGVGGQRSLATAGGQDISNLQEVVATVRGLL